MEVDGQDTVINITVKFSGRSIPISVSLDSTIKDVKSLLQPLTNVLPRGQKLIFKGTQNLSLFFLLISFLFFEIEMECEEPWKRRVVSWWFPFAGKLLVDGMTLRESEVTNGAKVMLMASQGLHQGVSLLFLSFLFFISLQALIASGYGVLIKELLFNYYKLVIEEN